MKTYKTFYFFLFVLILTNCSGSIGYVKLSQEKCQCSVSGQANWKHTSGMLDNASMQLQNAQIKSYFVVLSEFKKDLQNMELGKYSDVTLGKIKDQLQAEVLEGPTNLTINNLPAIQYKLLAKRNNKQNILFHTSLSGKTRFFQTLTWTAKDRYNLNEKAMKDLILSFKDETL